MKSVIVGTAGHIDHGKTALVRALTGIDADRLEEEKRRGITIDLGFANLELPGANGEPIRFGFVDVPGHERFVRNMLAGVGGIDLVLLVVSADEGVNPQTREHFDICRMLNIQRGITVLTKSDLVDSDTLDVAKLEVEEFVRGSFLDTSRAPMVAVSAITGVGLDDLRHELVKIASEAAKRNTATAMRLPIDRVFTMKGFGTVVTGTMISGSVAVEEEVELIPEGRKLRVRGVQVHNISASKAEAGQRTALNLAGVSPDELARGMTLASPGFLKPGRMLDVELRLLPDAKALKSNARVHLHAYTSETVARVVLLEGQTLAPGDRTCAQLRTDYPLALRPGDRFIIRQFSPLITIGGGVVLDMTPIRKHVDPAQRIELLKMFESGTTEQVLLARVRRRGVAGLSVTNAAVEMGLLRRELAPIVANILKSGEVVSAGETLLTKHDMQAAKTKVENVLKQFHDANRLVQGIGREELREKCELEGDVFAGVLQSLVGAKSVIVAGETIQFTGRGIAMREDESTSRSQIEQVFATAGLKVPLLKDVIASVKVDQARAQQIVTLLLREGKLVKLGDELVFHRDALQSLREYVVELKKTFPRIDIMKFKDDLGLSRKYAIPLLEWLDRERITRRVGDVREIL